MQGVGLGGEVSRRGLLVVATGCWSTALAPLPAFADPDDETLGLIQQLTGRTAVQSDRVRLSMPKTFPNGYTVPLDIEIVDAKTTGDEVIHVRVFAPKNPIVEVAAFHFAPGSLARVATRIRLAESQFVVAAAQMSNDSMLMAKAWVDVSSNGCK